MRRFNVTVNGNSYEVCVDELTEGAAVAAPVVAPVAKAAPVAAPKTAPAPVAAGAGEPFNAPMPGLVKSLVVANGATVNEGDKVLVLEAMKMDNDVAAHKSGVITFAVSSGANVNSGDVLFTIA